MRGPAAPKTTLSCDVGGLERTNNARGVRTPKPVRVLLVVGGETSLARQLLEETQDDWVQVVGWAETVDEATAMLDMCDPDVVLVADSDRPGWEALGTVQLDALKASLRLATLKANHESPEG
jgi:hypothetical protein